MKTFKKNNFLTKLLFIAFFVGMLVSKPSVIYGQNFIQIESILADACAGTQEGENEMVAFHTENSAINVADIRVDGASNALPHQTGKWPNNTNLFLGWILPGTANYDSAVAKIALINAAIVNCGKLIIPTGGTNGQGLIPAGKKGIIITSTDFSPFADDFSLLSDTLYVVFQKSGNTNGHFTNYGTSAMRYLRLHQISSGTNEDVSYNRSLLVTIAGTPGAEDGGGIRFTDAGVATYYNDGCQAPYIPLSPAWTPPASICQSAAALNLNTLLGATSTTGGTWSGTGVTGGNFNPAGLSGNISITYKVGTAPCLDSAIHTINVIASAITTWTPPSSICQSAGALNLNTLLGATTTTGGTWSGTNVTGNNFNPAGLTGNISITYTAGTAPCASSEAHNIQVVTSAIASWTPPASICQSAAALNLNTLLGATSTTGGTWSGTGVTGNNFNPAGLTGNISIKYLVGTAPCIDSAIHTINVIASAITTWTPPSSICQSAGALNLNTLLGATTTTGGTWSGTNVTGNNFNPAGLTGNISITYTAGTAPCASSEAHNIQVITSSIATWVAPATICETATPIDLNSLLSASTTTGGTWTGNGVTGNMFNPSGLNGNIAIKYEVGTAPCNSEETHNIQVLPSASAAWTAPTSICASASPIDLSLLITGDVGGTWSGDGVTGSIFTPTGLNGSIAISYFVNPSHTCPETITHSIEVSPTPSASWVAPAVICKTQATFDLNTLITGTTGGSWSGTGITSNIIDLTTIGSEVEVKYSVSNNGCSDELEATLHFSYVVADFNITPTSGLAPLNVTTTNLSQNAISYFWNFGNGSISTEENPEGVFPYEGAYFVWLKATSALGCVDSTFKMITVDESGDFIPNVFTPNGDNSNEEFYPIISKLTDNYNMMIFNRWGNLIFETHQQTGRWNGTYQGAKVPIGVYFYVISYSSRGKDTYYNGTVTVID